MWLLNINGLFQMPSYRSGAVEAVMTHRMAKDCLWLQIMHIIYSHYSANIQGRRRYVNCPSTSYAKDPIGDNMITVINIAGVKNTFFHGFVKCKTTVAIKKT